MKEIKLFRCVKCGKYYILGTHECSCPGFRRNDIKVTAHVED